MLYTPQRYFSDRRCACSAWLFSQGLLIDIKPDRLVVQIQGKQCFRVATWIVIKQCLEENIIGKSVECISQTNQK